MAEQKIGGQDRHGTAVSAEKGLTGGELLIMLGVDLATVFALAGCIALCTPSERDQEEVYF